jgi:hypothetical protein
VVIGFVAQIAAIAVDSIARRNQRDRGNYYDAMGSDTVLTDFKLDQRSSQTSGVVPSSSNPNDPTTDAYNAFGTVRPQEQQPYDRYAHSQTTGYSNSNSNYSNHPYQYDHDVLEQHHAGEAQEFYDNVPAVSGAWSGRRNDAAPQYSPLRSRMDDPHGHGYGAPTEQTHYDPGNYR